MKLQVVFSTANFVYKFKKSENLEKRRYNANGNANIWAIIGSLVTRLKMTNPDVRSN